MPPFAGSRKALHTVCSSLEESRKHHEPSDMSAITRPGVTGLPECRICRSIYVTEVSNRLVLDELNRNLASSLYQSSCPQALARRSDMKLRNSTST